LNNNTDYFNNARQNIKETPPDNQTDRNNSVFLCKRCELALRQTGHIVKRTDAGQSSRVRRCAICEDYCYGGFFSVSVSRRPSRQGKPNGF
jgi:hypothetical protein